ncbi:MAG: hypothetical protein A2639_03010 [Candidatus Staskawiczbacteria bacterium RIFCSPHIGHO2_01_FULL_34_27]|uniref:Uncharacterized protein n=2 Tax=Candidatus Staskawicziibacteriota TaxID=1817916 RepID=A0A1G2HJB8_9BACT|nr:MAG: hypothetical protein A2639_03010 [Candidatus Staskawiczbacteria bacterium RIFCSPHIGHO2_01_FULL_34_27]OGZ66822.1 MAG: hypothetical protein A3D34_00630 [Candidatus Staskawiczbacteria bacterium RIFCSPHIGHO2_02_FULL_33_16]
MARKGECESYKRKKIWQSASKPLKFSGRFRDYNRNFLFIKGRWYSPFPLEIKGIKRSCRPPCNSERGNIERE